MGVRVLLEGNYTNTYLTNGDLYTYSHQENYALPYIYDTSTGSTVHNRASISARRPFRDDRGHFDDHFLGLFRGYARMTPDGRWPWEGTWGYGRDRGLPFGDLIRHQDNI